MPPELIVAGVGISVVVPALVQGAKELGLPTKYAGLASVIGAAAVLGLVELQRDVTYDGIAGWALLSLVYGLAAAGLYSQVKRATQGRETP